MIDLEAIRAITSQMAFALRPFAKLAAPLVDQKAGTAIGLRDVDFENARLALHQWDKALPAIDWNELAALRARVAQLKAAHRELAQICWEGGSLDGGELQDILVKHGVLVETTVERPCSEYCNCEDNDAVFPTTCYRAALKDAPQ